MAFRASGNTAFFPDVCIPCADTEGKEGLYRAPERVCNLAALHANFMWDVIHGDSIIEGHQDNPRIRLDVFETFLTEVVSADLGNFTKTLEFRTYLAVGYIVRMELDLHFHVGRVKHEASPTFDLQLFCFHQTLLRD